MLFQSLLLHESLPLQQLVLRVKLLMEVNCVTGRVGSGNCRAVGGCWWGVVTWSVYVGGGVRGSGGRLRVDWPLCT